MKLKQRLLLAPILIFLYLITKPHWSDDDSPWEHRSRYVGKVVRRDTSDHPYQGAFVSVPNAAPAAQQQQQQQQPVAPAAPVAPVKPVQPIQPVVAAAPRPYPVDNKPVVAAPGMRLYFLFIVLMLKPQLNQRNNRSRKHLRHHQQLRRNRSKCPPHSIHPETALTS